MSMEISLNSTNKTFCSEDTIKGKVKIRSAGLTSHNGIVLYFKGLITIQPTENNSNALGKLKQEQTTLDMMIDLQKSGKLNDGITSLDFEIPLYKFKHLPESYKGYTISISYGLKAEVKKSSKPFFQEQEVFFISSGGPPSELKPLDFVINEKANKIDNVSVGQFEVYCHINSIVCNVNDPFTGNCVIRSIGSVPIVSIELQLFRLENVDGKSSITEIQNIQIVDGNAMPGLTVPIYMVFPRQFTCENMKSVNLQNVPLSQILPFRIDFQISINIIFSSNVAASKVIPITLQRF